MTKRFFLIMLTSLAMSGCTSRLSHQQCLTMDWQAQGYQDGSSGRYARSLTKETNDCRRFKLTVNHQAYKRGWQRGARNFCQPKHGLELGLRGSNYNAICPKDLAYKFERQWRRGLRRYCTPETGYQLGRSGKAMPEFCAPNQIVAFRNAYSNGRRIFTQIQSRKNRVDNINRQLRQIQGDIRWLNNQIYPNLSPHDRRKRNRKKQIKIRELRHERKMLINERNNLNAQITRIEAKTD